MKKSTKSIAAGSAGALLLVAGIGTYAMWNDSAAINADNVGSGELDIEATAIDWGAVPPPTLWVPNDSISGVTTVTLTLAGDNLESVLTIDPASIKPADPSSAADLALVAALSVEIAPGAVTGGGSLASDGQGGYTVEPTDKTTQATLEVPVTVTISMDDVDQQIAQNGQVDLSELAFALTQTAPTP